VVIRLARGQGRLHVYPVRTFRLGHRPCSLLASVPARDDRGSDRRCSGSAESHHDAACTPIRLAPCGGLTRRCSPPPYARDLMNACAPFLSGLVHLFTNRTESLANPFTGRTTRSMTSMLAASRKVSLTVTHSLTRGGGNARSQRYEALQLQLPY
jgi:hypothetical protein